MEGVHQEGLAEPLPLACLIHGEASEEDDRSRMLWEFPVIGSGRFRKAIAPAAKV